MTWWDFLSDFINILNDIFSIHLFDVFTNDFGTIPVSIGGLLVSVFVSATILFFFIPRK